MKWVVVDADGVPLSLVRQQSRPEVEDGCALVEVADEQVIAGMRWTGSAWVEHRPPPPEDTETVAHEWDAETREWTPRWKPAAMAGRMRAERDRRIAATDWTQLPDVPAGTAAAWAAYRQALRDITGQPGWPTDITWPTPPSGA